MVQFEVNKSGPFLIQSDAVTRLATLVEESTRSSREGIKYFLEPAPGVLNRATSKCHHIIFGRRGSGKSSLLRKVVSDLTVDRTPIGYVDLEEFKGHSYPDVLISVLIKTLSEFKNWLDTAAINPATKTSFWKRLFGATPKKESLNRKSTQSLSQEIDIMLKDLNEILTQADERKYTKIEKADTEHEDGIGGGIEGTNPSLKVQFSIKESAKKQQSTQTQTEYLHKKIEILHQNIMRYKDLFRRIADLSGGVSFLLLDDLYHIRKADQAHVVDYFHRIAKGSNLWLKVGTIRHRSRYYFRGDPPIGMKLGDDADEIDLDITLEKFDSTKKFLMRILEQFADECGVDVAEVITDGGKDRLILASGGVARDFLTIFRRAVEVVRERIDRKELGRGGKIGAEDINVAAGAVDDFKREDFNRDSESNEDRDTLLGHFTKIVDFCTTHAKANCFLIEKDYQDDTVKVIPDLVDFKFLHRARSRVTLRNRKGRLYDAYMLDVSQYTGERARKNFTIVTFWGNERDDALRKASYVFAEKPNL